MLRPLAPLTADWQHQAGPSPRVKPCLAPLFRQTTMHRLDLSAAPGAGLAGLPLRLSDLGLLDKRPRCFALQRLQALRQSSEEDRYALERTLKERLAQMDTKMKDLRRKEKGYAQVERLKARSEDTCARLSSDIQAIKHQKVGLGKCLRGAGYPCRDPTCEGPAW